MIDTEMKNPDVYSETTHVDLNESAFQQRWRLMAMFNRVAHNEAKLSKKLIRKAYNEMEAQRGKGVDPIIKIIDNYIGDHVVFYYGPGDGEMTTKTSQKSTRRTSTNKGRKKKKTTSQTSEESTETAKTADPVTTQDALSKNLKGQTKNG